MKPLENGMSTKRLKHYQSKQGSHHHRDKYLRPGKSFSHRRECAILRRLLNRTGHSHTILDAPCGAGRFFPLLARYSDQVFLGDVSAEMLEVARGRLGGRAAGYTCLDLRAIADGCETYEGVVSLRLTHHIYDDDVLDRYFRNLGQLARQWVLITFRDARSPRTISRRWFRRLRRREDLPAQTLEEVAETMRAHGLHLLDSVEVSRWFSGHRYALFTRNHQGA